MILGVFYKICDVVSSIVLPCHYTRKEICHPRNRLFCPYTAPYFSVHDYLAQPAFGSVVCRRDLEVQHESEQVADCIADLADAICLSEEVLQCLRLIVFVHPPTEEFMTVAFSMPRFRSSIPNAVLHLSDVLVHASMFFTPFVIS